MFPTGVGGYYEEKLAEWSPWLLLVLPSIGIISYFIGIWFVFLCVSVWMFYYGVIYRKAFYKYKDSHPRPMAPSHMEWYKTKAINSAEHALHLRVHKSVFKEIG